MLTEKPRSQLSQPFLSPNNLYLTCSLFPYLLNPHCAQWHETEKEKPQPIVKYYFYIFHKSYKEREEGRKEGKKERRRERGRERKNEKDKERSWQSLISLLHIIPVHRPFTLLLPRVFLRNNIKFHWCTSDSHTQYGDPFTVSH